MASIARMRNLGPTSEAMLKSVGIKTANDVIKIGEIEAFVQLKLFGYNVNNNMLWALHGAIHDCDWRDIDKPTKDKLLAQVDEETTE